MTFIAQTPWVSTGGDFLMRVRVDRPTGASNLEFAITLFPAVVTRSEFGETLSDQMADSPLVTLQPVALSSLRQEANGEVVLTVPVRDPALPRDPSRVLLPPRDGVYPVRVELRDRLTNTTVDRFVTHLLHMPELHATPKLGVSLVFPVHAQPALQTDGTRKLPDADALAAITQGLDAVRSTPFTVAPTPETVASLATSNDSKAKALLAMLKTTVAERPTLTGSYVPANLAALLASGLDGEVASQLGRGSATLADTLAARTDPRTWLAEEALDPNVVDLLAGRGFDRVIAGEGLVAPIPDQKLTLTRPFVLAGRQTRVQAVAADAGLAALARAHSADMRDRDYFDHDTPEGVSPFDRARAAGLTTMRAENIAQGQATPAAVMADWMDSPGHRANILDCDLTTLGVGVAYGPGGPWWTQDFGG
jgi:hypothetical protein